MQFSEYTGYLRRFGLVYTMKEIYYRFFSNILERHFSLKRDKDSLRYLKRYLKKNESPVPYFKPLKDLKPCIWTCWLQGYDNAPPVVKACITSMRKYANGYEVIVITSKNMADYVSMPDYIMKKYKDGDIQAAHFSDLLRTLLLINYGGIWLDATVLLTKEIPQTISNADFFVFQSCVLHANIQPCSSWFIVAHQKNNHLLLKVFDVLTEYWKNNKYLVHYFLFHIAVRIVITYDYEAKQIWEKILYKNNSEPHILQMKLFDEIDIFTKDYIWDLSFAHKLTYKFKDEALPQKPNTYYAYIVKSSIHENNNQEDFDK